MISDFDTSAFIIVTSLTAVAWAFNQFLIIAKTPVKSLDYYGSGDQVELIKKTGSSSDEVDPEKLLIERKDKQTAMLIEVYEAISVGAQAFLYAEYRICFMFCICFAVVIVILVSWGQTGKDGVMTAIAFAFGAITSIASGYIGMRVAVFSNVRTTINAQKEGYKECFNTAFRYDFIFLLILFFYLSAFLFLSFYSKTH